MAGNNGFVQVDGHSCGHVSEGEPSHCPKCYARLEAELASRKEVVNLGLQAVNRLHMEIDQLRVERGAAQAANAALVAELISCKVFLTAPGARADRHAKIRSIDAALKETD